MCCIFKATRNCKKQILSYFFDILLDLPINLLPQILTQVLSRHRSLFISKSLVLNYYNLSKVYLFAKSMGNSKLSSAKSIKLIKQGNVQEVSRLYHCKLFNKNKKTLRKFELELISIVKRLGYLAYGWSKTLCKDLKNGNINQLYAEYKEVLKQNCRRQGQNEVIFHSQKTKSDFLDQVNLKYSLNASVLAPQGLKQFICECKCFLMALNWLKDVGMCNVGNERSINQENSNIKHLYEDKSLYALLINAARKTYQQYSGENEQPKIIEEVSILSSSHSRELLQQVIQLKKKTKMQEKEEYILKIQNLLIKEERLIDRNIELIRKIIGNSHIFAHLLAIKEIGTSNVQFLWNKFYGNRFEPIFC